MFGRGESHAQSNSVESSESSHLWACFSFEKWMHGGITGCSHTGCSIATLSTPVAAEILACLCEWVYLTLPPSAGPPATGKGQTNKGQWKFTHSPLSTGCLVDWVNLCSALQWPLDSSRPPAWAQTCTTHAQRRGLGTWFWSQKIRFYYSLKMIADPCPMFHSLLPLLICFGNVLYFPNSGKWWKPLPWTCPKCLKLKCCLILPLYPA